MNRPASFRQPFRLHQWLVRPDLNRISGPEGPVQIEPRVMAVLLALAERPGAVVTRLDLLDAVWGDAVVGEEILTRAVSELRRVFGDDARRPRFIETIRNHGYRLIAPVSAEPVAADRPPAASATAPLPTDDEPPPPAPSPPVVPPRRGRGRFRLPLALGLLAVLLVVLGPGLLRRVGEKEPPAPQPLAAVPLTAFAGREYHPALSPDGTRVAFAWSGPEGGVSAIYIKQRNSETPLRLGDGSGWTAWPAWSPDGQSVAFVRTTDTLSVICLVPSLGGAVRQVQPVPDLVEGLDWSPDGRQLAFSARDRDSGLYRIFLLDLTSLALTPFAAERPDAAGDSQPRFSPDGRRLAWLGHDRTGGSGVFVADLTGGPARSLVFGLDRMQGLAWAADGKSLVYAAAPAGVFSLRQVPVTGGAPRELSTAGVFAWNPTVARDSGDLVYEQVTVDQDLWRVRIHDRVDWRVDLAPLLTSTRWEFGADYRPDGGGLAFVSARGGQPEIWLAEADGASPQRLTTLGAAAIGNLRWAPDGRHLACNAVVAGEARILVVDPAGGVPRRLTTGHPREVFGAWAAGGAALLVGADAGQGWQVHRLPLDGRPATQLTRAGGLVARESADGSTLYYTRPDRPGLWRQHATGRLEPELVLPDLLPRDRFNWRLRGDRLIWTMRARGAALLVEHDLRAGQSVLLAELPGFEGSGLAVAPRGDTFVYPRLGEAAGDLMLVAGWSQGPEAGKPRSP